MITAGDSLSGLTLKSLRDDERVDLDDEDTVKILEAMSEFAAAALEAGVQHTWKEWTQFSTLERFAWVRGARVVRAQEARRSALAMRGAAGYLAAGADVEEDAIVNSDDAVADDFARRLANG